MKKILLFVGLGLAVVVLTAGATYLLIAPRLMAAGEQAAQKNLPTPPSYELGPTATLDTRVVNLADPGAARYLKITVVLAFSPVLDHQDVVANTVKERTTILQDILTSTLGDMTTQQLSTSAGKEALKQMLKTKFSAILVEDHIVDIFFPDFVMQ